MKKLSKIQVRTKGDLLSKDEMKLIVGGLAFYTCCCGDCDPMGNYLLAFEANNVNEAMRIWDEISPDNCTGYAVRCVELHN